MASTYSPNLRLELIGTGEQQGTWGATTNTNLGTLLEEAIGGYTSVTVADAGDTTLTTANGAADQSRNMTINLTGTLTASRNVIVPAIEKVYLVKNATSGGFAVTVKVSGQTGVSIANGTTMLVFVDGTDVRQAGAQVGASNSLVLAAGSASAPSLTTTGDTNTGLWFPAADTISASTGGTERMRIDASGNVGIGTASPQSALNVVVNSSSTSIGGSTAVAQIGNSNSSALGLTAGIELFASGAPSSGNGNRSAGIYGIYESYNASGNAGALSFATNPAGTTSVVERMRIDSSGNVGINQTAPASYGKMSVFTESTDSIDLLYLQKKVTGTFRVRASGAGVISMGSPFTDSVAIETNATERMRIDSSGNITASGATNRYAGANQDAAWLTASGTVVTLLCGDSGSNGNGIFQYNRFSGGILVRAGGSGGVSLGSGDTSWASVSDERAKDIIEPITDAASKVSTLRAVIGKYKDDESAKRRSFLIAQDVQNVLPEAIDTTDPDNLGLAYTDVIPLLVAAIKEQQATITSLEARIAALEAAA